MKPSNFSSGFLAVVLVALAPAGHASTNLDLARQLNQAFVEVAEKVSPAVVVITTTQKNVRSVIEGLDETPENFSPEDFWRRFHRQFENAPGEESLGQGSGIIVREDGYILTNSHVVEDAETITVRLRDGRTFKARVRGVDPQSDVAVLQIDARGLPFAKLADSTKTRVGELAIAIGTPFNLDYSVTFGHVSAKGRANVMTGFGGGAMMDQDFIQTDANINPGNSGGPLVNIDGEVIGINTLIRGLRTGIGFAIPSSLLREVSDQIIAEGKFTRAWLGVSIVSLKDDPEYQELIKGVNEGVVIRAILPNGPAARSELKPADVVTAVDGRRVTSPQELRNEVRGKKIGAPVTLDVFRAGTNLPVKIIPVEWVQPGARVATKTTPRKTSFTNDIGLTVQPLTRELAAKFGLEATAGVLVASVRKSGAAALKNIQPGDLITSINQQPVATVGQYSNALARADLAKGVLVNLVSGDTARFVILKPVEE
jgi:Do/DeqQ family serine protease